MKKTRLKFSSAIYLIAFRRYSKASFWEIDLSTLTVLCDCSKKEALSACHDFGAEVLEQVTMMQTAVKENTMVTVSFSINQMQNEKMPAAV